VNQQLRTCIIGAGSSGLATAKVFHERGLSYDCFEISDRVGGLWAYDNPNGRSGAYRSLHINTSKTRMAYSDFPMPESYPDFPGHREIARYFESYVDHFGFRQNITFRTRVVRAERHPAGGWAVTLDSGDQQRYDNLVVANGHHWDPRWPEPAFPGHFSGREMHSHDYRDPAPFKGLRVVVVGIGNSAVDIADETSQVAERTFLSTRRGAWILPKYVFGRPVDTLPLSPHIPWGLRQRLLQTVFDVYVGRMERFGLPTPDHLLGHAHPTISSTILNRLAHGDVVAKPNIAELSGDKVRFTDGSIEPVDVIIYCTGYRVTFEFFDPAFLAAPDNDLPLFRRVFDPRYRDLFFIGLLQPLGAIMPLAEAQSHWIADYLTGHYALPAPAEMRLDMGRERTRMFQRYVASKRHTMQVDFEDYLFQLDRERRRGEKRAKRQKGNGAASDNGRREASPAPSYMAIR
jgi:cation diffusion facilitator CzcD-associated flavoprotein CzcO